jgi:hypothetical protein
MNIQVMPIPNGMADRTGAIQWVRLLVHANQNSEMGKQNAASIDMGSRASGLTLWLLSWYFRSK